MTGTYALLSLGMIFEPKLAPRGFGKEGLE